MPTSRTIHVPLDLSAITSAAKGDRLKVVARTADGTVVSDTIAAHTDLATAKLDVGDSSGGITIAVGPPEADDLDILDAETLKTFVPSQTFETEKTLQLAPLRVGAWYWGWWRQWCRTITVTGRVIAPDGRPVPGAEVTAYDVDWWWWWMSKQQVATAVTGIDGTYTMTFTWCCGLFPWPWWFRMRSWEIDPVVQSVIVNTLERNDIHVDSGTLLPSMQPFAPLLDDARARQTDPALRFARPTGTQPQLLADLDPTQLDGMRERLAARLPRVPDLEKVGVWPWVPWRPWLDCRPDLVFTVTQRCGEHEQSRLLLDEGYFQTRWDVPDRLSVGLVTSSEACCAPEPPTSECMAVATICNRQVSAVAGNGAVSAPASVDGFIVGPGVPPVDSALDLAFAGVVSVNHTASTVSGIDYYGIEHSIDNGVTWDPLPTGALTTITRYWQDFSTSPMTPGAETFAPIVAGPFEVQETWRHHQDTTYGDWSPVGQRQWSGEIYQLAQLDTTRLVDGVHDFRVLTFTKVSETEFTNDGPVKGCDGEVRFTLAIDNRAIGVGTLHHGGTPEEHPAGVGTVHLNTDEPEAHFENITVAGQPVEPCAVVSQREGDLVIEFTASDVDGHLAGFSLETHYGAGSYETLLSIPGAVLQSLTPGQPSASSYAQALALGATRPTWHGGRFRLTVPASKAFPIPCCYLLRLIVHKRVVDSCQQNVVFNVGEMTLGVGV